MYTRCVMQKARQRFARCSAWLLVGLLVVFPSTPGPAAERTERPNILFILIDDLRWDALGCTGHPFARTPHIDRIAREGGTFHNAFVTTPLCSPSRASFLTGQYVHTHGIRGNGNNNARSHELVTFPKLIHDAGYETGYFGKWHMGNDDSPRPGFDRWVSFKGQGAHVDPETNSDGRAQKVAGYMADILTEHAVQFIRRPRTKPFLVYLSHKAVHGPFVPAERHKGLFADRPIQRAPGAKDTLAGKPVLQRKIDNRPLPGPGTGPGDELVRNQLRMLTAVDEGVGRILAALEETKQLDNTLIVFTSDNGYFWGEHGLGDKRAAYEESIRIPLLMRYPRIVPAGREYRELVLNVDIAPTLLAVAGVPLPKSDPGRAAMQGRSLIPVIRAARLPWRQSFFAEYFTEPNYPRIPNWQAVRTNSWKYIHYPDLEGMDELYDLRSDPHEMKNRIDDPDAEGPRKILKEEFERLLKATEAAK